MVVWVLLCVLLLVLLVLGCFWHRTVRFGGVSPGCVGVWGSWAIFIAGICRRFWWMGRVAAGGGREVCFGMGVVGLVEMGVGHQKVLMGYGFSDFCVENVSPVELLVLLVDEGKN